MLFSLSVDAPFGLRKDSNGVGLPVTHHSRKSWARRISRQSSTRDVAGYRSAGHALGNAAFSAAVRCSQHGSTTLVAGTGTRIISFSRHACRGSAVRADEFAL